MTSLVANKINKNYKNNTFTDKSWVIRKLFVSDGEEK